MEKEVLEAMGIEEKNNIENERTMQEKVTEERKIVKCPFCNSSDYKIANDNSIGGYLFGIIIAIILFITGIFPLMMIGGIIVASVIFSYITITGINKTTIVARCNKCNQVYKIKKEELRKQ